jgi:hypothetical protein
MNSLKSILLVFTVFLGMALIVTQQVVHASSHAKKKKHETSPTFNLQYPHYRSLLIHYACSQGVDYSLLKSSGVLDSTAKDFNLSSSIFNELSKPDQLAYLINRYNFETLRLITKNFPLKSIRDLDQPWKQEFITLFGKPASLDQIENDWIRKRYSDPRIHFAINCASKGCPALALEPYEGKKLEQQFSESAKVFLLNPLQNQIDKNQAKISHIFEWYGADFIPKYESVKVFIQQTTGITIDVPITYLEYDWNLNQSNCFTK